MAVPDHEERSTLLSSRDVAALNRARAVLKRIEDAAWRRSLNHYDPFAPVTAWDLGRLSEAASTAEGALFHLLTTARANCGVKVTDTQLYGPHRVAQEQVTESEADAEYEHEEAQAPSVSEQVTPAEAPAPQLSPRRPEDVRRPSTAVTRGSIRAV
jgi:hypothetical protein